MTFDRDSDRPGDRTPGRAFQTISEVARELDLPAHVLRFWETKFSEIRPLKRGGGRRYYRPEDIQVLRRIQRLLHDDGYTIRGAQRILRDGSVRPGVMDILPVSNADSEPSMREQLLEIYEELLELRQQLEAARNPGS